MSILTNYILNIKKKFLVNSNSFFPKPKVDSLVICFEPKKKNIIKIDDISNLEKITNIFFSNKRKMINKVIRKNFNKSQINFFSNINLNLRPAELEPENYYKITRLYEKG